MIVFSHDECMQIWTALQQSVDNSEPIDEKSPPPSKHALSALDKLNTYVASLAEPKAEDMRMPVSFQAFRGHLMSLAHQVGISPAVIEMWFQDLSLPFIAKETAALMFAQGKQDDLLKLYLTLHAKLHGEVIYFSS